MLRCSYQSNNSRCVFRRAPLKVPGSGATEESSTPAVQRQMGGEQYADKLSVQTEGSDRLLAKSKRAWTCLSALTRGSRALITGYWSLSETQSPRRPYVPLYGKTCKSSGDQREHTRKHTHTKKKTSKLTFLQQRDEENLCSGSPPCRQIPGCHIQGCLLADLQLLIRSIKS